MLLEPLILIIKKKKAYVLIGYREGHQVSKIVRKALHSGKEFQMLEQLYMGISSKSVEL